MIFLRGIIITLSFLLVWQLSVIIFQLPAYILPSPIQVFAALYTNVNLIAQESLSTILETLIGLFLGTLLGSSLALMMTFFRPLKSWLLPLLIVSQALPTFAIAPLLVIWFGYGIASKIVTIMLMLFFPVASAFFDGLRRTDSNWLDLANIMGASTWRTLWCIRIPAALPHFASGLRVATATAPIGAIIGEWVGASHGLGFLMLNANARMQIDLMFATLIVLVFLSLVLYFSIDKLLKYFIYWQKEN